MHKRHQSSRRPRWVIAAAFFGTNPLWIDDFIPDSPNRHEFLKIPAPEKYSSWHTRTKRATALWEWARYWAHSRIMFAEAGRDSGVITIFPQLALMASLQKRILGKRNKLLAYCFNIGKEPGRLARRLGGFAFRACDMIVVHSRSEIALVSNWFGLPIERIRFVPLQCGALPQSYEPDQQTPYIVAMGSANRDYRTLAKAAEALDTSFVIVASPRSVQDIELPPNVTLRTGLSMDECRMLVAKALLSVIPLVDGPAASGQVTLVEAMRIGSPVVTTRTNVRGDNYDGRLSGNYDGR